VGGKDPGQRLVAQTVGRLGNGKAKELAQREEHCRRHGRTAEEAGILMSCLCMRTTAKTGLPKVMSLSQAFFLDTHVLLQGCLCHGIFHLENDLHLVVG